MMFHMTSKVFQDIFLTNEKDQDILDAQYVLVSSRIRRRNANVENIISATLKQDMKQKFHLRIEVTEYRKSN